MSVIPERCQCCEREIKAEQIVMLELDQRNNTYHDFGGVPDEWSQGWFPFGQACARNERLKATAALNYGKETHDT